MNFAFVRQSENLIYASLRIVNNGKLYETKEDVYGSRESWFFRVVPCNVTEHTRSVVVFRWENYLLK